MRSGIHSRELSLTVVCAVNFGRGAWHLRLPSSPGNICSHKGARVS